MLRKPPFQLILDLNRNNKIYNIVISVKNRLKSRPTFAHLLPQRDKAVLYLAEGRSLGLKIISGKPDNFHIGSL